MAGMAGMAASSPTGGMEGWEGTGTYIGGGGGFARTYLGSTKGKDPLGPPSYTGARRRTVVARCGTSVCQGRRSPLLYRLLLQRLGKRRDCAGSCTRTNTWTQL